MEASKAWDMQVQAIEQRELLGKNFKVYGTIETPLFLAKDVAEWIEYSKTSQGYYNTSKMLMSIDEDEKITITNSNSGGGKIFLTEDGLYEVLFQSRKPIAKIYKKEVKKILKQLRLTGGIVKDEEEFIKNYFPSFSEDVKQVMLLDLRKQNENYKNEIETKNKFIKQIAISENTLKVEEVAQIASKNGICIGRNRLWEKIRQWGLIKKNSKHTPKQEYIDRGYFEVVEGAKETAKGVFTYNTTRVTGKGQVYIINRLLKEQEGNVC